MDSQELGAALRKGERVYGTLIVSTSPHWPSVVKKLGLDFVFLDTEHTSEDRIQLTWMCQAYKALNLTPIVRITSPDPYLATVALDGGAGGIISPYTETVAQVKALRGAVKLRPLKGKKLQAILDGDTSELNPELEEYIKEFNKKHLLILNIESVAAMENLSEILKVPDIDAILIGPHDLSCSLGIPEQYNHPKFDEAVRFIITTARQAGIGAGIHYSFGLEQEVEWAKAGQNLILHASDIVTFADYMTKDLAKMKEALGDTNVGQSQTVNI